VLLYDLFIKFNIVFYSLPAERLRYLEVNWPLVVNTTLKVVIKWQCLHGTAVKSKYPFLCFVSDIKEKHD